MRTRTSFASLVVTALSASLALLAHAADIESRIKAAAIPSYPDIARVAGISGTVEVAAAVDGTGACLAHIVKSSNELFNEASLAAARKWRLDLGHGEDVRLIFRFTSLPACSIPARTQIYSPPFVIEVFAAKPLATVLDGEQDTCPRITFVDGSNQ